MSSALSICGTDINIHGYLLRTGSVEGEKYRFVDDPRAIVEGVQQCGRRIDLFTFLQRVSETSPKFSYPMEWDNFAVLPITTFNDWLTKGPGFKGRNKMAKQAERKGIKVREIPFDGVLIEGIWRIYNECPIRQGKRFPHYGMPLERVLPYAATFLHSSIFIGAFLNSVLIGFAKLVVDETRTQAGLMHIISMIEHRDKAPSNALIAQAVKSCANRNIPYLVYSNFAYGSKQRDSLTDFKERNGFQRVNVPRYYVPLTRRGRLALRMGLHHRLVERLPGSVIAKLREYRTGWYHRKPQPSAEAS